MTDLATLGLRIQSHEVAVAADRMDDATASAGRLETAEDRLATAARRAGGATEIMNAAVVRQVAMLNATRAGMGLTAAEGLNLGRQFADIGVTAAMGMNPLMIALQQGPQLLDIFQQAATRTGQTTSAVARQMAAAWATALWPILPVIAAIGAAAGGMAAGFALATRDMSRDIGDLRNGLNLTEDQLKRLKESGEQTTLTMGDYFRALGTTIKEMLQETFGPQLDWVRDKVGAALDWMTRAWATWIRIVLTGVVGAFNAIRGVWSDLPAVMADVTLTAANAVIRATEKMINGAIGLINGMLGGLRQLSTGNAAFSIFNALPNLKAVDFDPIANRWEGSAARAGRNMVGAYQDAWRDVGAWQADFMDALESNARASGQARVRGAAGEPGEAEALRQRLARNLPNIDIAKPGRIDLNPLNVRIPEGFKTQLETLAEDLRLIDRLASDAGRGMADAFGEAGRSLGDLLTAMTTYQSRMAEIALAEQEHRLTAAQADRERASATIQNYGDMASAAKGFFKEGSDGYRILQAAEQAYRLVQFAMAVQSMALDGQQTASSVSNSLARGAASTAAGAAKMFEMLGPFAFPVVIGMLALLAGLGLRGGSGSSGGGSGVYNPAPINDGSAARAQTAASGGTASGRTPINFDLRGAVVTSDLLAQMQDISNRTAGVSVQVSRTAAQRDRKREQRFELGLKPA